MKKDNEKKHLPYKSLDPNIGNTPPSALELEACVLGAIMLERDAIIKIADILTPEMFYTEANKEIAKVIWELYENNQPIDLILVTQMLRQKGALEKVGGAYYVTCLSDSVASSAHIEFHCRIIIQQWILRKIIEVGVNISKKAYDISNDPFDLLDEIERDVLTITDKLNGGKDKTMDKILIKAIKEIEKAKEHEDKLTGIPSGFTDLDRITNGFQNTDLIILAARPSMGKSALALMIARNAVVMFNKKVAVFEMEMEDVQMAKRLISSESEVQMSKILSGKLQNHDWQNVNSVIGRLANENLIIDDKSDWDITGLSAKCKKLRHVDGVELIIIDYLQLMHARTSNGKDIMNREQEISKIARGLKKLAKDLKIPIIALAQLSRAVEQRSDKRPQLSDLRESGAIEQDADMVCFLYRPEYYGITEDEEGNSTANVAEIIIAKHRNGSLGNPKIKFLPQFTKFIDNEEFEIMKNENKIVDTDLSKLPNSIMNNQYQDLDDEDVVPF